MIFNMNGYHFDDEYEPGEGVLFTRGCNCLACKKIRELCKDGIIGSGGWVDPRRRYLEGNDQEFLKRVPDGILQWPKNHVGQPMLGWSKPEDFIEFDQKIEAQLTNEQKELREKKKNRRILIEKEFDFILNRIFNHNEIPHLFDLPLDKNDLHGLVVSAYYLGKAKE